MASLSLSKLRTLLIYVKNKPSLVGADNQNKYFFGNPDGYLNAPGNNSGVTVADLSLRQLAHLKGALGTQLKARIISEPDQKLWMGGSVATLAICRPSYNVSAFVSNTPGNPSYAIPADPLAAMLMGWDDFDPTEKKAVKIVFDIIARGLATPSNADEQELKTLLAIELVDILK